MKKIVRFEYLHYCCTAEEMPENSPTLIEFAIISTLHYWYHYLRYEELNWSSPKSSNYRHPDISLQKKLPKLSFEDKNNKNIQVLNFRTILYTDQQETYNTGINQ